MQTHASVVRISGVDKHEADAELRLTHLPVANFTRNFNTAFPQQENWYIHLLTCTATHQMLTMPPKVVTTGLSSSTLWKESTAWQKWDALCTWLCIPEYLEGTKEPVPFLYIFTERVHS